jgi:hypothetical protein
VVVAAAGDSLEARAFRDLVDSYNSATRDHLAGIPFGGPNSVFALLTRRHMRADGLGRETYVRTRIASRSLPVNTSGGQLSAGQAGAAGGLHGLVEVVRQLRGGAADRVVDGAEIGLVTGSMFRPEAPPFVSSISQRSRSPRRQATSTAWSGRRMNEERVSPSTSAGARSASKSARRTAAASSECVVSPLCRRV